MFRLQLFGGASLLSGSQPLEGPVAQRRRLALLALLAVADSRALTRDRAIAMLWPESEADRARHLLSESVYVIRKALGEASIRSAGDEIRLDAGHVACDVAEFRAAVRTGDLEQARELYRGPFLDGWFLPNSSEFERWVESERVRLATEHRDALQALIERKRAQGDAGGTLDAWRQLATVDPYNARVALGFMQALADVGERAAAIRHARVLATMFREELGAEPDPEVETLAARLRVGPTPIDGSVPNTGDGAAVRATGDTASESLVEPVALPAPPGLERSERAGEVRGGPLRRRSTAQPRAARRTSVAAALGTVVILLVSAWLTGLLPMAEPPAGPAERETTDLRAIAVLPFIDLGPGGDHEWLGDGLAEEVITTLGRLDDVAIAARGSAFAFKGSGLDTREIGRRLGVSHVLEGSIRRAGDRLRVGAQLVGVADGYQLWSETYLMDIGEVADVFEIQESIARAIVERLRGRRDATWAAQRHGPPTRDAEAFRLYQLGRFFWNKRTPDGLTQALEHFGGALERDRDFAEAWAGTAESYALLVTLGALSPPEGYARAQEAAERALALDPSLPQAHAALGLVALYLEHDWVAAEARLERALRLSPSYATGRQWYAQLLAYRGDSHGAVAEMQRAQQLDPLSLPIQTAMGTGLYYARRFEDAEEQFRFVLTLEPEFFLARLQLAAVHFQQRRYDDAIAEATEAARVSGRHPLAVGLLGLLFASTGRSGEARAALTELGRVEGRYVSPAYAAAIHMGLGDLDAALAALEQAFETRDDWLVFLRAEPVFDPLRNDPRFAALLARVGP